jgi:hypothetical protein
LSSPGPPTTTALIVKADSGASNHYFRKKKDQHIIWNLKTTPFGPAVLLPDSTAIHATHSGQLPLHPSFSEKATTAHVLAGITNASLLSIGQLCDDNCVAVLDKDKIEVFNNNSV